MEANEIVDKSIGNQQVNHGVAAWWRLVSNVRTGTELEQSRNELLQLQLDDFIMVFYIVLSSVYRVVKENMVVGSFEKWTRF